MKFVSEKYRSWIPGIVFWVLFLASLVLGKRYSWLDTVWNIAWLSLLLVLAICAVVQMFRDSHATGAFVGCRGVPRWAVTLFGGGEETEQTRQARQPRIAVDERPTTND